MSGEAADKPEGLQSQVPRRRRPLRVPIVDTPRATVADDSAAAQARFDDEGKGASNVVELDPLSGATAPFELVEDRDPTEPSLPIEPDPLGGDEPDPADLGDSVDLSDASIEVHFSDPPEHRPVATAIEMRQSEPPEELFLEDADVLSRSDIAPPLDQTEALIIPIPKPPPPPTESAESAPAAAQTPEDESWYERFFGEAYLRTVRTATPKEVAAECDFIERALRVPAGSRVLDVGCGLGAQTVDLASRGYQMVGLDISATMVSRAVDEAVDRGLQIEFMCGDMREVTFEEPFEALLCWGTTFGYFNEEENELAIRQFRRALKPNGTLLLDIINRDFMIGSQPNQVWFEVDTAVCMEETDFDYETSRLRVKRRVASHSGQQTDRRYSIRLYALHEIRALLERNGFRIDEVSGREATLGVFFGVHSPKMIIRAERLPGPFADEIDAPPPARTPPIPKGALKPSEFPSDRNDDP